MKVIARKNINRDPFWNYLDRAFFSDLQSEKPASSNKNNRAPMNIIENNNVYTIELLIPGWKKSEISIEIEDDTLKISGEKSISKEETNETENFKLREFKTEKFYRSVILGDVVDRDSIEANLEDGVLNLVLPKVPEAQPEEPKKIAIK
ncbi:Hsp20/alpha crystallin family protein [Membranihabitans maritimus]|uniref:Hsp20/alpha crystallin family protein n=1 Tax=Membranihabitans maritimus TaxID=2904244 RepID=UPI001F33854D|nr:Hsp20/alpha crystallin family protein [Membranihabitans maritimus]